MKPHIKVTTNSTQVGDTSRDIANPATVDVGNLAKFSKSQGIITFWLSNMPSNNYIGYYRYTDIIFLNDRSIINSGDGGTPSSRSYDFSTATVGDKLKIKWYGNDWCGAYELIFGEVVE